MKMVTIQVKVDTDWVYDVFTAAMIQSELVRAEQEYYDETGISRNRRFNFVRLPENPLLAKIEVLENGKPVPNDDILVPKQPPVFQENSLLEPREEGTDGTENDGMRHFPPVDPVELSNRWKLIHGIQAAVGNQQFVLNLPGDEEKRKDPAEAMGLHWRVSILGLMEKRELLKDWIHDGELDEIIIRVAAKFPMEPMKPGVRIKAPYDDILKEAKRIKDMEGASS